MMARPGKLSANIVGVTERVKMAHPKQTQGLRVTITVPRAHTGIVLCALLFLLQTGLSARQKSLTWDEPTFIVSGLSYLHTGVFKLNAEAPPLPQYLAALPLLLIDIERPDYASPEFEPRTQVVFARRFMQANAGRIDTIAGLSRFSTWLIGSALVLIVGLFAARLMGPVAGLTAAAVTALSPTLIAHARLATSDAACALGMFASVYAFHIAVHESDRKMWAVCGVVCGLAVLSKFTALLLGPILALFLLIEIRRGTLSLRQTLPRVLLLLLAGLATLTVGYLGKPWLLLDGISRIYTNLTPGYQFYLLGNVYDEPVWYYYLAAVLIKTPLPILLLLCIATWILLTRDDHRDILLYCGVPIATLLFITAFDQTALGPRRVLPAFPFAFATIGVTGVAHGCRSCHYLHRGLLVWCVAVAVIAFPHHLSYFNALAGGPTRGPYLMDDSNVDWGQDLPALAVWQRQNQPDEPIRLFYFGTIPPELYGITHQAVTHAEIISPKPGVYAISAHLLVYIRKTARKANADIDWLEKYRPFDRAGYSIYLYRFPQ